MRKSISLLVMVLAGWLTAYAQESHWPDQDTVLFGGSRDTAIKRCGQGCVEVPGDNGKIKAKTVEADNLAVGTPLPAGAPSNSAGAAGQIYVHGATPVALDASPALARFRSALAKGTASVVIVGDSTGEGYNATDQRNNGWAYIFAHRLQAAYGNAGPGFIGAHRTDVYTFSGTWANFTAYGVDAQYATGTANTVSMSAQWCSSYVVYFMGTTTIDVNLDGGGWQTLTGTLPTGGSIYAATVSTTLGAHALQVRPSGSTTAYFHGVQPIAAATGVTVHNISLSGASSGTYGGLATQTHIFQNLLPDLVIVALGINDAGSSVDASTYTANVTNITNRATALGASVLILGENATTRTGTAADNTIQAAQKALAIAGGFDYINVVDRWGSYTAANAAGLMNDLLHPSNAGHLDIADFLTQHLTPSLASRFLQNATGTGAPVRADSPTFTGTIGFNGTVNLNSGNYLRGFDSGGNLTLWLYPPTGVGMFKYLKACNAGLAYCTAFDGTGMTANRSVVVPDADGTLALKVAVPTHNTDACKVGAWAADANYHYWCNATGDWKRVAVTAGTW